MNHIQKKAVDFLEKSGTETLRLARKLVQTPSINFPPSGSELQCQELIRDYALDAGLQVDFFYPEEIKGFRDHPLLLKDRDYTNRPVVVARLPGGGGRPAFILSGHVDTVPPAREKWNHQPFSGEIVEGRLYGLGSYDMKGGLAAELAAIRCLKTLGIELPGDVIFESVVDEEYSGCGGTLASRLRGYTGEAVILAEPSDMRIYPAHRGYRMAHMRVKGHSGIGLGDEQEENPITKAKHLVDFGSFFQEIRNSSRPSSPYYDGVPDPVPVLLTKLAAGSFEAREPITVPSECKLEIYWQTLPEETREEIEEQFIGAVDRYCRENPGLDRNRIETEFVLRWLPGTQIPADHRLVKTVAAAAEAINNRPPIVEGAPFPCDLFIFNKEFDIPGIILGPGGGNAHAPDEFVQIDDLVRLSQIYAVAVIDWFQAE